MAVAALTKPGSGSDWRAMTDLVKDGDHPTALVAIAALYRVEIGAARASTGRRRVVRRR